MIKHPMPAFGICLWKQLMRVPGSAPFSRRAVESAPDVLKISARYYRALDIVNGGERELMDDGFIGVLYNARIRKAPFP